MAKRRKESDIQACFSAIAGFRDLVDDTFQKFTGKPISAWLSEFGSRPRELPQGEPAAPQQEPAMSLANAYAVLGLKRDAPREDVEKHYRALANLFHPDKGGYAEAMVLLNQAYEAVKKQKGN